MNHVLASAPRLLLFHGLLSSPQEFALIERPLRMAGVHLDLPQVPDYTEAVQQREHRWQKWQSEASKIVFDQINPDTPVVLGGLCMGGVLAAAAALAGQRRIAGLVLISPTFSYDGWGLTPLRHLRHIGYLSGLDRFFHVSEREPYGVKNPRIRQWLKDEMLKRDSAALGPARLPLRAVREGERMMAYVRRQLASLDCPVLVMHAREDEITRLASVEKLFAELPQRDKQLIVLENSYHMTTIDNARLDVVKHLTDFMQRIGAHSPPSIPAPASAPLSAACPLPTLA